MKISDISVEYIDHFGSDLNIVNAARVSFSKKSNWEIGEFTMEGGGHMPNRLKDADGRLIRYLAKHKHFSPFNHAFLTVRVKAPIFVARQLVKHEYMPWNEVSRRYVNSDPEFYLPEHKWRMKSADKKQGSADEYIPSSSSLYAQTEVEEVVHASLQTYNLLKKLNVCPEQARMVLPQNLMTEWIWSGSLKAFAKMLKLRLDPHTQYETRLVAERIEPIVRERFPVSLEALLEAEYD